MAVLVIAEIQHGAVTAGTFSTIHAARQVQDQVEVLVVGHQVEQAAQQLSQREGVAKVYQVQGQCFEHAICETLAPVIVELAGNYTHICAPSSTFGKNLMPRVAALKDVMLISDIIKVIDDKTFERPIYAGNAIATVESSDALKLFTVRATAFDQSPEVATNAPIETLNFNFEDQRVQFESSEIPELERPELTSARVVVSGGRGLQNKENFKIIESLADKLNAAIGASRAAVDAGFVPNDYQVGQTGKIVAPELYIAIGISGAIQHLAGMKDSKVIVAINKDAEAPIFQIADYGLVGDLFSIVPEFEQKIS